MRIVKKIFYIKDFINACGKDTAKFTLSPERQKRAEMLFSTQERQRFIAAEIITLDIIGRCFGIHNVELCGTVSQKPYIKNCPDLSFSRSYCADALCVAVEDAKRIGVDAEMVKNADEFVMKYFFTEREKAFVESSSNRNLAFSFIWTRKESYIKCIGEGLRFRLDQLDVAPKQPASMYLPLPIRNDAIGDLYIKSYVLNRAVVSVCSEMEDTFPTCIREWSAYEENDY